MDPMRALASLEFVSARGLDTADQGPAILANQVVVNDCDDKLGANDNKNYVIRRETGLG